MEDMNLIKGDCIEALKKIPDKSVDFVYTDLPYNQTACSWDQKVIDLDKLWIELKRIAKNDKTPFFFSCTTRFGYKLIKANEKWFRWDLVWKKNRASGFLNAYKLPMRKHEMIYCFAKNSPEYDVSDHLTGEEVIKKADSNHIFLKEAVGDAKCFQKPHTSKTLKYPLPTTDITPPSDEHELVYCFAKKTPEYDVSSHKEFKMEGSREGQFIQKGDVNGRDGKPHVSAKVHTIPLPTSVIPPSDEHELVYCFAKKSPEYDVSSHSEVVRNNVGVGNSEVYGIKSNIIGKTHKIPLPTSVIPPSDEHELVYCFAKKSPEYDVSSHKEYEETKNKHIRVKEDAMNGRLYGDNVAIKSKTHNDPLPTSDITPPSDEHELVYCFAKKSPEYDVSSHKEYTEQNIHNPVCKNTDDQLYGKVNPIISKTHKDPLPTTDITQPEVDHEIIYCFANKTPEYNTDHHLTGDTYQGNSKNDIFLKEAVGNADSFDKPHTKKILNAPLPTSDITTIDIDEQPPSSWCEVNNDEKTGHRTAKPVALMEFLLKYWTKPEWTVLDPTMGSGSMGIACKKMGRKFIGMEMDDEIYKLAQKRISEAVVPPL